MIIIIMAWNRRMNRDYPEYSIVKIGPWWDKNESSNLNHETKFWYC